MNISSVRIVALGLLSAAVLTGCKKIPALPVPDGVGAQVPCGDLTLGGFPRYAQIKPERSSLRQLPTYFICRPGEYAMEYDPNIRMPRWTVQTVDPDGWKGKPAKRRNDLRADPLLPVGVSPTPKHWEGSEFKPLQLVPATMFENDEIKLSHTFYASTTISFNPGSFEASSRLNQNIRRWAEERGKLIMVSGPILEGGKPLGWVGKGDGVSGSTKSPQRQGKVAVPSYFYRIILDPKTGQSASFVIANAPLTIGELPSRRVSISQVEQWAGITFFPMLDPQSSAKIRNNEVTWPLK